MELQVGVKILLKNKDGKYLLLRRNPKKYPEVGPQWDIVGGRIEPGSSLIDNLKREIKEEVGLEYKGEPELVAAQDILVHRHTDLTDNTDSMKEFTKNNIPRHVVRLTYVGQMDGIPHIDDDHLQAGWFTADEVRNLENLDSYVKELIEQGLARL